jgi:hypothetical protein
MSLPNPPETFSSKRLQGHLHTLADMVAEIVTSGKTPLSKRSLKAPDSTKAQSRTKRFERCATDEIIPQHSGQNTM